MFRNKKILIVGICIMLWFGPMRVEAEELNVSAPSAILMEPSTGKVIYEKNPMEKRSPASITKIMTLLITMEKLEEGSIQLSDPVVVSEYAQSMGGSQVFLAQGEVQTLDTMLKCITVSSANDASVAVAEHIAGSEEAFVDLMNQKALELGMVDTHFCDCCGLTEADDHYTTAMDVAVMSAELITKYPKILEYSGIWMDTITHETKNGSSEFGLSSTNKLLKQYPFATGLKTGSTSKAKYCISATANKDGMDLVAVIMGAEDPRKRFSDARTLLTYGFGKCKLYADKEEMNLPDLSVKGALAEKVPVRCKETFRYLDTMGIDFDKVEKRVELVKEASAPLGVEDAVGKIRYFYDGKELGNVVLVPFCSVEKAGFRDWLKYMKDIFLL